MKHLRDVQKLFEIFGYNISTTQRNIIATDCEISRKRFKNIMLKMISILVRIALSVWICYFINDLILKISKKNLKKFLTNAKFQNILKILDLTLSMILVWFSIIGSINNSKRLITLVDNVKAIDMMAKKHFGYRVPFDVCKKRVIKFITVLTFLMPIQYFVDDMKFDFSLLAFFVILGASIFHFRFFSILNSFMLSQAFKIIESLKINMEKNKIRGAMPTSVSASFQKYPSKIQIARSIHNLVKDNCRIFDQHFKHEVTLIIAIHYFRAAMFISRMNHIIHLNNNQLETLSYGIVMIVQSMFLVHSIMEEYQLCYDIEQSISMELEGIHHTWYFRYSKADIDLTRQFQKHLHDEPIQISLSGLFAINLSFFFSVSSFYIISSISFRISFQIFIIGIV